MASDTTHTQNPSAGAGSPNVPLNRPYQAEHTGLRSMFDNKQIQIPFLNKETSLRSTQLRTAVGAAGLIAGAKLLGSSKDDIAVETGERSKCGKLKQAFGIVLSTVGVAVTAYSAYTLSSHKTLPDKGAPSQRG